MRKTIRFFALVLSFVLVVSLFGCNGETPSPTIQNATDYFKDFQPVLRFAALSDSHIDEQGTQLEESRLVKVLQVANNYAAKDKNHSKLDAVLVAGDFVDYGTQASMEKFRDLMVQNISADTKMLIGLGNHEYYVDKENTAARFESVFGVPINEHTVINGFHFIKLSPDGDGNSYSPAAVSWLEAELSAAAAEDPAKPIFVMQHHAVKNTLFLSNYTVAVDNLRPVFEKYPQVVDFSGHSHYPIHNPRQIWQGEFTALGTGTLSYHSLIINNLELPPWYTATHDGTDGNWVFGHKKNKDGGEFYLVEVDAKGAVMVIAYDVNADAELRRYYIQTPADPSSFLYTDDRIAASQAPVFAEGSTATVSNVVHNGFDISFPQATCDDLVESYRVEVYSDDILVNTTILTSCFYLSPLPTTMVAHVRGLQASTEHTVKVIAVNAYNKDCSAPLRATVTTGELNLTAADSVPDADIFHAVFDENGSYDGVSGTKLGQTGTVMLGNSATLQRPVSVLMGASCYTFDGIKEHYSAMEKSVTFAVGFKYTEYDSSLRSPFANLQNGGLGFEIDGTGLMKFTASINGSYRTVNAYMLEPGQYYYLMGTYDGEKLRIYINGAPVNELTAPGAITWPADETAHYLAIGGDSGLEGKPESMMKGELVIADIYSAVLTPEEVYRAYLNVFE